MKSNFENNLPNEVFLSFQPLFFDVIVVFFFVLSHKIVDAEEIKINQRKALAFSLSVTFSTSVRDL